MRKISTGYSIDLVVNFAILAINLIILTVILNSNISLSSVSLWERAINRSLLIANVVLALLSFQWIYSKRKKFQKIIKEITITNENNKNKSRRTKNH
jgi:hypothetical protein